MVTGQAIPGAGGIGGIGPGGASNPSLPGSPTTPNPAANDPNAPQPVAPNARLAYPPGYFVNPPLDSPETQQYNTAFPHPKLFRGWIMEDPQQDRGGSLNAGGGAINGTSDWSRLYRLNFHFNPAEVAMTWDVSVPDVFPGNLQSSDQFATTNFSSQGVNFSFNILLDRVNYNPKYQNRDVTYWGGVNADVRILNAIMTAGQSQPGQGTTFAQPAPVVAYLGRRYDNSLSQATSNAGDKSFGGPPVRYPLGSRGFITSLDIDYQRFDTNMTPTRAVVSISIMTRTWNPDSTATDSPSASLQPPPNATRTPRAVPRNPGSAQHRLS